MPDWKTHFIFALFIVIAWLFVFQYVQIKFNFEQLIALVGFSLLASLFADVDTKQSKIRDVMSMAASFAVSILYIIFFMETWYYGPVYFVLLYLILKYLPSKHRGITHTFRFSFLFSMVLTVLYSMFKEFSIMWFAIIFSSYSLHLILDKL